MRVLIVHISDFHIHSEMPSAGDARFMQMRKSLANLDDYEAVFILFTGDAAFSGKAEEYERVEPLFSRMEEVLLEGYEGKTATLVVPGNHDLDLPKDVAEDEMTRLHGKPIWGDFEQIANDQKGRMVNYNAWAANRDCSFGDAQVASKEVCAGKGKNDATLRFSLINTVPISIWTTTTDKQFHYIDERSISLIAREEDSDLHIALAHHSPEWFAETVKRPLLEAFQSYVDILLLGHDHVAGSYERIEDDGSLLVLPGGKCDFAAGGDFTFSSIELDMDKYPYDAVVTIHRWQAQCQRFDSNVKPVRQIVPKRGAPVPNTAFLEQIGAAVGSSLLSAPFMDYFVFPPLMCVSVYDTIAYSCAESDTVGFLCEYDCDDSSARVLKVCMKENALDSKEFIDAICNAGADCKDQGLERTLLRLVANKHIVTHPNIGHRDIDRIAQHLFGSSKAKKNYIAGRIGALTSARTDKE